MSETAPTPNALTTEQVMAQAPGVGIAVEKRSLQMRYFKTKTNIATCVRTQKIVPLGQIVGLVYSIVEKPGTLPNGEKKTSLLAYGQFESLAYETGEINQAMAAYLPDYFCQALKAALEKGAGGVIELGIEIVAEPTGLNPDTGLPIGTAFSYGVRNLRSRRADDPLELVKRQLGTRLRLPVAEPVAEDARMIALPEGRGGALATDTAAPPADGAGATASDGAGDPPAPERVARGKKAA